MSNSIRTDHIGRPVFATNDVGVKVWQATFLPFGGAHKPSGTSMVLRFRRMRRLQKLTSVHSSVHNNFNQERHLYSRENFKLNRAAALAEWRQLGAA